MLKPCYQLQHHMLQDLLTNFSSASDNCYYAVSLEHMNNPLPVMVFLFQDKRKEDI